jgi:peroxiredoxin
MPFSLGMPYPLYSNRFPPRIKKFYWVFNHVSALCPIVRETMKLSHALVGAILIGLVALAGCNQGPSEPPPRAINPFPLPEFELPTPDGKTISSSTLKGNVALINFWTTWSPSSIRQMNELMVLRERYQNEGESIQILGIAINTDKSIEDIQSFISHENFDYPIVIADREFPHQFKGIDAIPSTFVVDPSGMIVNRYTGVALPTELDTEVRYLLAREKEKQ